MALSALGPFGAVIAEFATQIVPRQRLDRLHDFIEQLNQQLTGLEALVRERIAASAAYASLAEEASLAAVRTASPIVGGISLRSCAWDYSCPTAN